MNEEKTTIRVEIDIPPKLQDAAGALIALGVEFARHDGFRDFTVEEDGPLNISRAMRITIALNFATSMAASAAYDALKSNTASGSSTPPSIVQNVTNSSSVSVTVTPQIPIAGAGEKPTSNPPVHKQGGAHHGHSNECGREHDHPGRHGQNHS